MGRKRQEEEYDDESSGSDDDRPVTTSSKKPAARSSKKAKNDADEGQVPPPSLFTQPTKYPYTDLHRAVLQLFMVKKVVEEKTLEQLTKKLGRDDRQQITQLVREINDKLLNEDMHLQIRSRQMVEEEACPKVWALVNVKSDDIAKEATSLELWQLALFNQCLQLLAKAPDGAFSHSDAIHAYHGIEDAVNKSANEILLTLNKLAAMEWLRPAKAHYFTAGARTLIELADLLRDYGATECSTARQVVLLTRPYKNWLEERVKAQ